MSRDFSRQEDLVPMDRLRSTAIAVVGVGAVGRNVALQLAAMGASNLTLVDHDIVDASNVCTQGYWYSQIGAYKVNACHQSLQVVDPEIEVTTVCDRWRPTLKLKGAVFCCVDSMEARQYIYRGLRERADFWCDGRMQGFSMSCYADKDTYEETLFPDSEAEPGRCTAKSTIFAASGLASAMIYQFVRWLRGEPTFNSIGLPGNFVAM